MGLADDLLWAWAGSLEALNVCLKLGWLGGLLLGFVVLRLLAIYCCGRLCLAGARRLRARASNILSPRPAESREQAAPSPAIDYELARLSVVPLQQKPRLDKSL